MEVICISADSCEADAYDIYNVISFFLLGMILEKYVGSARFFVIWFISGAFGTLISTLTVEPPFNLGTGASQAVLGVVALGIFVLWKKMNTTLALKFTIAFTLIPALLLDLAVVYHPKLGHIGGFLVGWCLSLYYFNRCKLKRIKIS